MTPSRRSKSCVTPKLSAKMVLRPPLPTPACEKYSKSKVPRSKYKLVCLISYRSRRPEPPPTLTCFALTCSKTARLRASKARSSPDVAIKSWAPRLKEFIVKVPESILKFNSTESLSLACEHNDLPQIPLDDVDPQLLRVSAVLTCFHRSLRQGRIAFVCAVDNHGLSCFLKPTHFRRELVRLEVKAITSWSPLTPASGDVAEKSWIDLHFDIR